MIILMGDLVANLRRWCPRQPEWSAAALIEFPHFVRAAHDAFIAAGADVIRPPTLWFRTISVRKHMLSGRMNC